MRYLGAVGFTSLSARPHLGKKHTLQRTQTLSYRNVARVPTNPSGRIRARQSEEE